MRRVWLSSWNNVLSFCFVFSSDAKNVEEEPPLYMELEKENPLYDVSATDAVLNPIYDRFVSIN